MEEREALLTETAQAEVLLLKAQVHPHFLFNTLNNIYSFSRRRPGISLRLIESLSSTVRYMTTECSAEVVSLEKELESIRDYIELERVRYSDRLNITLNVQGECEHKCIAPLLLIPLVENCFKHGASQLLETPWIKVLIFIEGLFLRAEISNNKPLLCPMHENRGIGIANVRKRLSLLHPGNHTLEIRGGEDTFLVRMQVPLYASTDQTNL
jgi:LytS/YehU family sensor histidine kinase